MIGLTALSMIMQRAAPKVLAADQQQRRVKNAADAKVLRRAGMVGTKEQRMKARDERAAADKASQASRAVTGDKARSRSDQHRSDFAKKSQSGQQGRAEAAQTKRENATTKGRAAGDNARADAEQRKQDSAQRRADAQERSKAKREESAAKGRNASDEARKRAADRKDEDEEHLYTGRSRSDKARDRAAQRSDDSDTSRDLGVTQKQVREERAWQQQRAGAVQEAVRSVVKDTAGLGPLPGGHIIQQAKIAAAVVSADAAFQLRTIRPILRDRAPAQMQARLSGSFSRLEDALTALAS